MKKSIPVIVAIVSILFGVAVGVNTNRYFAHQHEKTTAVMVLLQLHLHDLETAGATKNCTQMDNKLHSLQFLAKEIPVVLPLADQQDAVFHRYVTHLQQVLSLPSLAQCAVGTKEIKQINDACDDCHRDYR